MQLTRDNEIIYAGAAITASSSIDGNSSRIDTQGYDGVVFFTTITDSVATGVATLTVEQNTADSDSGMAALSGGAAAKTCTVNDDINGTTLIVDVYKPKERYLQGVRTSGTANIAFGEIYAILYGAKNKPITQSSTNSTIVYPVSPAEA